MLRNKLLMLVILGIGVMLLSSPVTHAWPKEQLYVPEISNAPDINGITNSTEWPTSGDSYQDTQSGFTFDQGTVDHITLGVIALRDANFLYLKVTWENQVTAAAQNNSIGVAFGPGKLMRMDDSIDRKLAYWDGTAVNTTDFHNCAEVDSSQIASCQALGPRPGGIDAHKDFTAAFGVDNGKGFFEFKIALTSEDVQYNEDLNIGEGTHMSFIVNPFADVAKEGHAAIHFDDLEITYVQRCFLCPEKASMDANAVIFNTFFALLISMIFISFIFYGRSDSFAKKMWRLDVDEDMAKQSAIMEIAYYNSTFIPMLVNAFFLLYTLMAVIYGLLAGWGLLGLLINGIPMVLGVLSFIDLMGRNQDPKEVTRKLGTDVQDSQNFWLVPTLFLALTLLMLVFIGINVIATS